ncbi:hypothetical protein DB346_09285 [Verrucomicrobia bacterium LW23]|nr:hypothetical protein DB346_09285 [Verrucomicrobia bacterium LW23]
MIWIAFNAATSTALLTGAGAMRHRHGVLLQAIGVVLVAAMATVTAGVLPVQAESRLRATQTQALPDPNSFYEGNATRTNSKNGKKPPAPAKLKKVAMKNGVKADGSADYLDMGKTSNLGDKTFEWKGNNSLMKEASFFQRKFQLPDVLSGKTSVLSGKPMLEFNKEFEMKTASGFEAVYEGKKSNLTKEWGGAKTANISMKESSLQKQAQGFDTITQPKAYYGPLQKKLEEMDPKGNGGNVTDHQPFDDSPITIGQVRDILKNGNQDLKPKRVLKASAVNDKPSDTVGDADTKKRERQPKVSTFLPSQSEQEAMDRAKAEQEAYEADKRAAAAAEAEMPGSAQRGGDKPLLVVPITEEDDESGVPPSAQPPLSIPASTPPAEPAAPPVNMSIPGNIPASNDEEDMRPTLPTAPSAPAKPSRATPSKSMPSRSAPAPHYPTPSTVPEPAAPAPAPEPPQSPAPFPGLPDRLGRGGQGGGTAPTASAPAGSHLPVVQITDDTAPSQGTSGTASALTPTAAGPVAPAPAPLTGNSQPGTASADEPEMLVPLSVRPLTGGNSAPVPTTSTTPSRPVSSMTVPSVPSSVPTPATRRAVDAKRTPSQKTPSASTRPASQPAASNAGKQAPSATTRPSASNKAPKAEPVTAVAAPTATVARETMSAPADAATR